MKYRIIYWLLKLITKNLHSRTLIQTPSRFLTFSSLPPKTILDKLILAYQTVFSELPWSETWSYQKVEEKLRKELAGEKSFLTVIDSTNTVTGFSWGGIIKTSELPERLAYALGLESIPIALVNAVGNGSILFYDEFAISASSRSGIEPIRFLLRPGLELGYRENILRTLFWSTPDSKIVPLAKLMGYKPVYRLNAKGKNIIFLLNSDFRPLFKMSRHYDGRTVAKIMKLAYWILGRK